MITRKNKLRAILHISDYWVEADLHILEGSRLTDALNIKNRDFVACTDARIIDPHTKEVLYSLDYLAVNRNEVLFVFPLEPGEESHFRAG